MKFQSKHRRSSTVAVMVFGAAAMLPAQPSLASESPKVVVAGNLVQMTSCYSNVPLTPYPGFDPHTASSDELRAHDFLDKPVDKQLMPAWLHYVELYMAGEATQTMDVCDKTNPMNQSPEQHAALLKSDQNSSSRAAATPAESCPSHPSTTSNWSGNVVYCYPYSDAQATWNADEASGQSGDGVSHWAGINDGTSQVYPLDQGGLYYYSKSPVGAFTEEACNCPNGAPYTVPGWQNLDGDDISFHVTLTSSGTTAFHFFNSQTGGSTYATPPGSHFVGSQQSQAEFITEREATGLADFGIQEFSSPQAYAAGHGWQQGFNLPHYATVMAYPGTGHIIASPGTWGNSYFPNRFASRT